MEIFCQYSDSITSGTSSNMFAVFLQAMETDDYNMEEGAQDHSQYMEEEEDVKPDLSAFVQVIVS